MHNFRSQGVLNSANCVKGEVCFEEVDVFLAVDGFLLELFKGDVLVGKGDVSVGLLSVLFYAVRSDPFFKLFGEDLNVGIIELDLRGSLKDDLSSSFDKDSDDRF